VTSPRYKPVCLVCDPQDGHDDGRPFAASRWAFGARTTLRIHAEKKHGAGLNELPEEFDVIEVTDDAEE
jgi:hypothetical protein